MDRRAEVRQARRQHADRGLHVYADDDGTVVVRGRLAPEVGALLIRALDAARETLYQRTRVTAGTMPSDPTMAAPTRAQQQADALALLADCEQPGQSVLEEGSHVSAETSRRLACDASRVVMRHDDDGRLLEVGARTRTIRPALRRALLHRDRSCRFPGSHVRFGQGHHVRHWAQGGPTTLGNFVLLCRRHHHAVHEEGYRVSRESDGTLEFRRPDGRPLPDVPPVIPVATDSVQTLHAQHVADGVPSMGRRAAGWRVGARRLRAVTARGMLASQADLTSERRRIPWTTATTSTSRSSAGRTGWCSSRSTGRKCSTPPTTGCTGS